MTVEDLQLPDDVVPGAGKATASDSVKPGFSRYRRKDGRIVDVDVTVHEFVLGAKPYVLAVALDTTDRNRMEGLLRQAQVEEAIGSLDLSAVINGIAKMLRRLVGEDLGRTVVSGSELGAVRAELGQRPIQRVTRIRLCVSPKAAMGDFSTC